MGGSPKIPTPPPLPTPPPTDDKEDPKITEAREKYKLTLDQREGRRRTILTESTREGTLVGEEANVLRTKLGGGS